MAQVMTMQDAVISLIEKSIKSIQEWKAPWYRIDLHLKKRRAVKEYRHHLKLTKDVGGWKDMQYDPSNPEHRELLRVLAWPGVYDA